FVGGFWLIPHFAVSHILLGMIALLVLLSIWSAGAIRMSWMLVVIGLASVITFQEAAASGGDWIVHAAHVYEKNSRYYNIRVNEINGKVRLLMLDGSLQSARSLAGGGMVFPYMELSSKIIKTLEPSPPSVLVIGGGGYTIPEFIKGYSPDSEITVVEIDPD